MPRGSKKRKSTTNNQQVALQQVQQKKLKSDTVSNPRPPDQADAQEGPSTSSAARSSSSHINLETTQESSTSDKYTWSGNPGCHGFAYEKDLALLLFVAASLGQYSFRLATEMHQAGKFDDAVLILDDLKEVWFFQAKHSQTTKEELNQTTKAKHSQTTKAIIRSNDFFPTDLKEKSQFSLPMYAQSFLNIVQLGDFKYYKKRCFIFTNRSIDEDATVELEKYLDKAECRATEQFGKDVAVQKWQKFTPKKNEINDLLKKMNILPIAFKDAIVSLIESGLVSQILRRYSAFLQSVLQITDDNKLRFTKIFTENRNDPVRKWLFDELQQHFTWNQEGAILTLSGEVLKSTVQHKDRNIFSAKSRDNFVLRMLEENDLQCFFDSLVICSEQPDVLFSVRDKVMESFVEKCIQWKERGKFRDRIKLNNIMESAFNSWHEVKNITKNSEKPYLSSVEAVECVDRVKAEMRIVLQNISESDFSDYLDRRITTECHHSPNHKKRTTVCGVVTNVTECDRCGDLSNTPVSDDAVCYLGKPFIRETSLIAFLEKADVQNRCFLLVGEPGCGKSTFMKKLTHMLQTCERPKHVYLIYMNRMYRNRQPSIDDDIVKTFKGTLSESSLQFLQDSVKHHPDECYILLDGFDEIDVSQQSSMINIINEMFCKQNVRVLISSRNQVISTLVGAFKVTVMRLLPFFMEEQLQLLKNHYGMRDNKHQTTINKFDEHAKRLLKTLQYSADFHLYGLPLIINMLVEIYRDTFEKLLYSDNDESIDFGNEFNLLSLYESFVHISFNLLNQKIQNSEGYPNIQNNTKISYIFMSSFNDYDLAHQIAAIEELGYTELHDVATFQRSYIVSEVLKQVIYDGRKSLLIDIAIDNQIRFIHTSYGEYFVAKYLFEHVTACQNVLMDIFKQRELLQRFFFLKVEQNFDSQSLQMETLKTICEQDITLMYMACKGGHYRIVQELLKNHDSSGTALQHAVRSGNEKLVSLALSENYSEIVNSQDEEGRTPIGLAVLYNYKTIVELLLKHEASTFISDNLNQIPLHVAAQKGYLEIVNILLENDLDGINTQDKYGRTPLFLASSVGHLDIVKSLVNKYSADVSCTDKYGQTPLHVAVQKGRLEIARVLIDARSDVTYTSNKEGRSLLHLAIFGGKMDMVDLLFDKKLADVHSKDEQGHTPLHVAVYTDKVEIMKMLIEDHSANINTRDKDERIPFDFAAFDGNLEILKVLLDKCSADKDFSHKIGRALHWAVIGGQLEIMKMLIEKHSADIHTPDKNGRTLLHTAAEHGKVEILKVLINDYGVDIHSRDKDGKNLVQYANWGGYLDIVKMAIGICSSDVTTSDVIASLHTSAYFGDSDAVKMWIDEFSVDITSRDTDGKAPIHSAAMGGSLTVVKMLIDDYSVDINATDRDGLTPLLYAAQAGNLDIVEMLLDDPRTNINVSDPEGQTALHLAAFGGKLSVVKMLIDVNAAEMNTQDNNGLTLIHSAAKGGHVNIIKMLVNDFEADINTPDSHGRTPLHWAAFMGKRKVVKKLIEILSANKNSCDKNGRTPLHLAALGGRFKIVKMMIDDYKMDINTTDEHERTALHFASLGGKCCVLKMLVEKYPENVNGVDKDGKTPLTLATESGHMKIVEIINTYGQIDQMQAALCEKL